MMSHQQLSGSASGVQGWNDYKCVIVLEFMDSICQTSVFFSDVCLFSCLLFHSFKELLLQLFCQLVVGIEF